MGRTIGLGDIAGRTRRVRCAASALVLVAMAVFPAASTRAGILSDEQVAAVCARFARHLPGPAERATPADTRAFASEKSCLAYVWGPDALDYDKGRRCCLVRGDCNRELALIFANGWGVPRDLDAAGAFLCKAGNEMALAEQAGMLDDLEKMRAGKGPASLEYCRNVTSGVGMTFCEQLETERGEAKRERRLAAVRASLGADAQAAFDRLVQAADAFAEQEGALQAEPNRGGTIYPSASLAAQTAAREAFVAGLERLTRKRAPAATPEAGARADQALNGAYRALQTAWADSPDGRGVLRDAQRAWIAWRDAWSALYRLRWKGAADPEALGREIVTALTSERTPQLRDLAQAQ